MNTTSAHCRDWEGKKTNIWGAVFSPASEGEKPKAEPRGLLLVWFSETFRGLPGSSFCLPASRCAASSSEASRELSGGCRLPILATSSPFFWRCSLLHLRRKEAAGRRRAFRCLVASGRVIVRLGTSQITWYSNSRFGGRRRRRRKGGPWALPVCELAQGRSRNCDNLSRSGRAPGLAKAARLGIAQLPGVLFSQASSKAALRPVGHPSCQARFDPCQLLAALDGKFRRKATNIYIYFSNYSLLLPVTDFYKYCARLGCCGTALWGGGQKHSKERGGEREIWGGGREGK